ncbi:MAG: acetyl-CoA carboxylase biotin carboxylase subunit [Candidatus Eisenbacteria bacterium RBG_16_71_46]|nr:MAG: acetyl-CoA carboxylase biotin carboxylase subunit [Candidatus Eisenbacteria bacterium RBG_16_71_46]OGF22810.1 MAG: acetyl-CoA carboxylase biotin carboxylase subunit [Candidatus Eisenbacteria bacterium RBG_19FT_COMBO_70_11]
MFRKVLVANRGEIALRVIRACRELRIPTVAVFSEADRDSLHVRLADESVCIGPPAPAQSYNHVARLISAAEVTGVDAIHPGYGFLAENAHFAEVCASCGFVFIGPTPEMIRKMGDKSVARHTMREAGVPVVPGSDGLLGSVEEALPVAEALGYPVIIKATAGGGGRGMRVAWDQKQLRAGFGIAQAEAGAAFSNNAVYLEKYIERPRHIEFQIFGDTHGHLIHLGERECSVQRNHQKLIEEAPSPFLSVEQRRAVGELAVRGARAIGYVNAGTMEFLFDQDGSYYFMEMNTRIQVEHPVTEEVTGLDLVKEQIRVAAGEVLSRTQDEVEWRGHAIECRINAEDYRHGFRPSPGAITYWYKPGGPGIRVDSHVYAGYVVPPYYDSMVGKLIAYGKDRPEALRRMEIALEEMIVEGIQTTIPFHQLALRDARFQRGDLDTHFVESLLKTDPASSAEGRAVAR